MASPRPPALVRNVSLPVLHNSVPTVRPRPVTRVSSFSTFVKPSQPTRRELTDSDDDDGMVPQLPSLSNQDLHLLFEPTHHCPPTPPSPPPTTTQPSQHPTPLQTVRHLIRLSLARLFIFLPPTCPPLHTQIKFVFISAISLLLLLPATTLCYLLPSANNLHILTFLIALVPLIARLTASLLLSTTLLVAIVMSFTFTASALISPVVLVWSSVVPVITFATLGNRLGLASSAITAASIAAVDFSEQGDAGNSRIIIASWLLFLGVIGVVQKQLPFIVRGQSSLTSSDTSTVRRKEWHVHDDENDYFDEDHDEHYHSNDSDVEVPQTVMLHGRAL